MIEFLPARPRCSGVDLRGSRSQPGSSAGSHLPARSSSRVLVIVAERVVAEGDHELLLALGRAQLALEPAVLRVVDVAALAAALGDGVERDEAEALLGRERVVAGGAGGLAQLGLRRVAEAVRLGVADDRAVLALGDHAAVRVRRDGLAAGDQLRDEVGVAEGGEQLVGALALEALRVEGRVGEHLQAADGDRAEEVLAGGARCPGRGRRGCRARCTRACPGRPPGTGAGRPRAGRGSAGTPRTGRRSARPRPGRRSRRSGRTGRRGSRRSRRRRCSCGPPRRR